jgi:hypothetical protein
MHNALNRYFPEFLTVFKDWTGKAALCFLEQGYLPQDIVQASEKALLDEVKQSAKRVGIKNIRQLKQTAENSIGLSTDLTMTHQEIHFLIAEYKALKEQLITLEAQLEEIVLELHAYYRSRATNPLTGKQSFVALSRKLIKKTW